MKLAFQRRFLDDDGNPLNAGRITLYAHDSQTPLTVYFLAGEEYSPAANPMLTTNDGRIDTVFYDSGIIDVKVEKNNGDGTYELLDTYEDGLDVGKNGTTDTQVDTIEELRNVDPNMGTVTVVGYYQRGDAPVRMYFWDANSSNTIDGGYVIGSEVSDTGRWILIWEDEILPCTVYGVIPGQHEENISQFLGYPNTVSTKAIATARICRFIPGTYLTDQTYYTSKNLYFDEGVQFPYASFSCNTVIIPNNTGYVANFDCTGPQKEIHSSWFRTAREFLLCKAERYVIDHDNYFVNSTITGQYTIANAEVEFHTRLPITYSGDNTRITFNRCDLQGTMMFNSTDKLSFTYTVIHDNWWGSPADIDWVNNVRARTVSLDRLLLSNFTSPLAYVNAIKADGQTKLDLAGRYISSLDANGFTDILNVDCNNFYYNTPGTSVNLRNVKSNTTNLSGHTFDIWNSNIDNCSLSCQMVSFYDSRVYLPYAPNFGAAWFHRCTVIGGTPWTCKGQLIVEGGSFNASLNYVTDNDNTHYPVEFNNVVFGENNSLQLKNLSMIGCTTSNNTIKLFTYKDNDHYALRCNLEGNLFHNNNPIEFTRIDEIDGRWQEDVYDVVLNWNIVNNMFTGNSEGLRMRYWQKRTGSYYGRTFVSPQKNVHNVVYTGNMGNCPDETVRGMVVSDNTSYTRQELQEDTYVYKYTGVNKRVMPSMSGGTTLWWSQHSIKGDETLLKWYSWVNSPYNSLTYDVYIQTTWFLYHTAYDDAINDGDFFRMTLLTFGDYIRIVQHGDGDRNTGVVAKMV